MSTPNLTQKTEPPALAWKLAGEGPQASTDGMTNRLDVDVSFRVPDYAPVEQAAKYHVALLLEDGMRARFAGAATEANSERAKAERRAKAVEKDLAKLRRDLQRLQLDRAELLSSDQHHGETLAKKLTENARQQQELQQRIADAQGGLAALQERAGTLRQTAAADLATIAREVNQAVAKSVREEIQAAEAALVAAAGPALTRWLLLQRAYRQLAHEGPAAEVRQKLEGELAQPSLLDAAVA